MICGDPRLGAVLRLDARAARQVATRCRGRDARGVVVAPDAGHECVVREEDAQNHRVRFRVGHVDGDGM